MTVVPAYFDLQGHRGARGLWPENTLAGFTRTIALGVAGLELDCVNTRDDVLVVSHDPRLNPQHTRDAHGRFLEDTGPPIIELTYAQLQTYDVGRLRPGSAYAAQFPEQQAVDGQTVPRLTDVLELVRTRGAGRVRVNVEVKITPDEPELTRPPVPFVRLLEQAVTATDMVALTSVLCFDWRVLAAARELLPQVALVALTDQQPDDDTVRLGAAAPSPWLGGLNPERLGRSVPRLVEATGARVWSPNYQDLSALLVRSAHAIGLRVVPWTVNDPADMQRLIGFGVDGMISDRPDLLRQLLQEQGVALPPRPSA